MAHRFTTSYLEDSVSLFRYYKNLVERAIAQLSDEEMLEAPDPESNCVAIIVKHLAGNMQSRWADFLISDGEKPGRNRDAEFENPPDTGDALLAMWESGWQRVFSAIEPLSDADLARTVTIRGDAHSVMQCINRQVAHYSYHCGQIVFLAKHLRSREWKCLSIPRGGSPEFNRRVGAGEASQR